MDFLGFFGANGFDKRGKMKDISDGVQSFPDSMQSAAPGQDLIHAGVWRYLREMGMIR